MAHDGFAHPTLVISCIASGRVPTPEDVETVAARVWREMRGPDRPWREVISGSGPHQATMRVARAALGIDPHAKEEARCRFNI